MAALAAPDPLPEAAWSATATGSSFELMTEPGELPYLALAESGSTARLPLEHTHINAFLNGMVAEVEVRQTYKNPAPDAIEAVYTFPLPENSAVNSCKW